MVDVICDNNVICMFNDDTDVSVTFTEAWGMQTGIVRLGDEVIAETSARTFEETFKYCKHFLEDEYVFFRNLKRAALSVTY